jgi:hypothetical protein
MIRDGTCEANREVPVTRMKTQEVHDRLVKVFDVFGLQFLAAANVGFSLLGVRRL